MKRVITAILLVSAGKIAAVDFGNDVLPILQDRCFKCHDADKQKGGLRLDLRAAAMRGTSNGPIIIPGKSAESTLIHSVIAPEDADERMPPKGEPLGEAQISTLTQWIDTGANWPDAYAGADERLQDWAWQPLMKTDPPAAKNPVDGFIKEMLKAKNLTQSAPADRRTLARRLSHVLHGLPPSPETVENFVNDGSPTAYDDLVDRLLASPHYGERMARHWLDLAHYADTHGFERDKRRPHAWRYRDYVIDAFNNDKPYTRFLQEQIAGDVLWPDNKDAVVATGFLAAGPWDFVGHRETKSGVLKRAARSLDLDDMATQVLTSTMAVTINCARCHDHKLDPISQEEYFRVRAVFAGVGRENRALSQVQKEKLAAERQTVIAQINQLQLGLNLADLVGGGDGSGNGTFKKGIDPRNGKPHVTQMGFLDEFKNNIFSPVDYPLVDGVFIPKSGKDVQVSVSSTGITIKHVPGADGKAWDVIRNGPLNGIHSTKHAGVNFAKTGNRMLGLHANAGITFDLAAIRTTMKQDLLQFSTQLGYFGAANSKSYADAWIYLDGKKVFERRKLKRADGLQPINLQLPADARFLTLMATAGGNGIGMDQIGFGNPTIMPPLEALGNTRSQLEALKAKRQKLDKQINELGEEQVYSVVPAGKMPETRILRRGDAESPTGDPLSPGALSALAMLEPSLGELDSKQDERRAALATWITDPQNPLTARVIANRIWHWTFGQGLVTTPSDFGGGGDKPSHPELLDWLAGEIQRQNGSLKAIFRLLLTSETFKQRSQFGSDDPRVAIDAGNRLLWRQNARRLEAEAIRDSVLIVSGKLNPQRGGPGFEDFTYKDAYAPIYTYVTADEPKLWRRTIYRYIVRTTPDRFLAILDCPDPANMTPKRLTTTTPLQSLAMYNNDFMVKQARYFAQRLRKDVGDDSQAQVRRAFDLAFSRSPSDAELALASRFIEEHGLFTFCRSLLNANEFVYVD
jgi:hypothetical protein